MTIRGTGLRDTTELDAPIDVGNAGTLMRLLPGWLAGQEGRSYTLDGDDSIRRRPVDRIAEPLRRMGATIDAIDGRLPPFTVHGAHLRSIAYELPVATAQVKSCVLLAGLMADGATTVVEPVPSRDHTERMLAAAGVTVHRNGRHVTVTSVDELVLDDIIVPGDPSSAAFLIAAGVLVGGSRIQVVRQRHELDAHGLSCGSSSGWAGSSSASWRRRRATASSAPSRSATSTSPTARSTGTTVEADEVPLAIDELPLVALLGCFAEGETIVRGAAGAAAQGVRPDRDRRRRPQRPGRRPRGDRRRLRRARHRRAAGGTISSHGDHRLAMLGAIAGLASDEGVDGRRHGGRRRSPTRRSPRTSGRR